MKGSDWLGFGRISIGWRGEFRRLGEEKSAEVGQPKDLGLPDGLMQLLQQASPIRGRKPCRQPSHWPTSRISSLTIAQVAGGLISGSHRSGVPSPLLVEARHRPGHAECPRPGVLG